MKFQFGNYSFDLKELEGQISVLVQTNRYYGFANPVSGEESHYLERWIKDQHNISLMDICVIHQLVSVRNYLEDSACDSLYKAIFEANKHPDIFQHLNSITSKTSYVIMFQEHFIELISKTFRVKESFAESYMKNHFKLKQDDIVEQENYLRGIWRENYGDDQCQYIFDLVRKSRLHLGKYSQTKMHVLGNLIFSKLQLEYNLPREKAYSYVQNKFGWISLQTEYDLLSSEGYLESKPDSSFVDIQMFSYDENGKYIGLNHISFDDDFSKAFILAGKSYYSSKGNEQLSQLYSEIFSRVILSNSKNQPNI